jgi:hypothetical protein
MSMKSVESSGQTMGSHMIKQSGSSSMMDGQDVGTPRSRSCSCIAWISLC